MAFVRRVQISNLRNIHSATLDGLKQINVLSGPNGAGKTSVLEALSLLGMGRSFRSRKINTVITSGQEAVTVFAELSLDNDSRCRIGISRSQDNVEIKIDGQAMQSASGLASRLPLLVFDADVFQLVEGGPSRRREYIDWVLFHVEHQRFYPCWTGYYRALKQRNELLKRGNIQPEELDPWDKALERYGHGLSELRAACLDRLAALVGAAELDFGVGPLSLVLSRGWKEGVSLSAALKTSREKDVRYKTTSVGPHRMALNILVGGLPAKDILSRGQIKMLASQLKLAAARLVVSRTQSNVLILLDDLAAETDEASRKRLLSDMAGGGFQCFITGVFVDDVTKMIPEGIKKAVFHVEHGCIKKSSNYE